MTKRWIPYYRVSTERQGQSGLGLDAQRSAVAAYVKAVGGRILTEFTEIESGRKDDRPILVQALHRAKVTGATLLVAKMDRLARRVSFLAGLMDSGVDFVAVDNPNVNRLTVHILAAVAEDEAQRISERTKAALAAAKARGTRLGNPLGAKAFGQVDPQRAREAARRAVQARAADLEPIISDIKAEGIVSYRGIAAELEARGILAPRGGRWHGTSVRNLLLRHHVSN